MENMVVPTPHPLLIDHIIEQVIQYLNNDVETYSDFLSCRILCRKWFEIVTKIWSKEQKYVTIKSDKGLGNFLPLIKPTNSVPCALPVPRLEICLLWRTELPLDALTDGDVLHKLLQLAGPNLQQLRIQFQIGLTEHEINNAPRNSKPLMFKKADFPKEKFSLDSLKRLAISGDCEVEEDVASLKPLKQSHALLSLMGVVLSSAENLQEFEFSFRNGYKRMPFSFGWCTLDLPKCVTCLDLTLEGFSENDMITLKNLNLPIQKLSLMCDEVNPPAGIPEFFESIKSTLQNLKLSFKSELAHVWLLDGVEGFPTLQKLEFNGNVDILFCSEDSPKSSSYFESLTEVIIRFHASMDLKDLRQSRHILPKSLRLIHLIGPISSKETIVKIGKHIKHLDTIEFKTDLVTQNVHMFMFRMGMKDHSVGGGGKINAMMQSLLPVAFEHFIDLSSPDAGAIGTQQDVRLQEMIQRKKLHFKQLGVECNLNFNHSNMKCTLKCLR